MKDALPKSDRAPVASLLAAIIESSDDAIISKDLSGTITTWNKAAERIFGYEASEVIGGPISIIIPPERGAEEMDILQRIGRGERIEHFETVRVRKDGQRIEVSVTMSPLFQNGRVIGASKIARDITEQKRIAREIEGHRTRLEVTLRSIGDGVIVTDMNGSVSFMNPVAESLTGWKLAEAAGQPLEAVFSIVNETTRRRVENPVARSLREGLIVGLANHTILLSKSGSEYAIDDSAAPIRDKSGEISGVVLVFRDVSGSRAAQDFRARLAAIVQSSDDAIVGKDLTGRITSWNKGAARLFGYTPEEVIGRPISMLIPPDRLSEETDILARLRRGERIEHFETIRITKDRRKVAVSLTISPIHDTEGHVVGASKIARDITEKKRTERELVEVRERLQKHSQELEKTVAERTAELNAAYRELESFTYSVAHDLRAPLRRIQGFLTILQEELGRTLPAGQRDLLQKASGCADGMNGLVEDLLKLSQVGTQALDRQQTSLNELVNDLVGELKSQNPGRQVDWKIHPLPTVRCDPGLIRQAFTNLLSNALKYTRPRPVAKIEVGQKASNGEPAFYVADNGVGFDMSRAEKLFTPFQRLHSPTEFEGSGIGLTTVERIIRKHGGQVWAEAQPDRGATLYFTLPSDSQA